MVRDTVTELTLCLKFGNEGGDRLRLDLRSCICGTIEPAAAIEEIKKIAVAPGKILLCHRGKMAGRPTAGKPLPWFAGCRPAETIGFWPVYERQ